MIKYLLKNHDLPDKELLFLIQTQEYDKELIESADRVRKEIYGTDVYIRGLIELTNYCQNNCYYCGMRRDNKNISRYRLSKEEILSCCDSGYELGFRTFVLQGGEDPYYTDDLTCKIISDIKSKYGDCALTLSLGEKSQRSYKAFFDAGADRYLLRHETADEHHYRMLHPEDMSLLKRKECLWNLKKIGYQVGSGFMVNSPHQTPLNLIQDIRFLQELSPDMIGIGPYISHHDTPFAGFESGGLTLTIKLIAVLRLMFPYALIPATTALGTIAKNGREMGLLAGANVLMPNLSPQNVRELYKPYDNKICTDDEAAEHLLRLKRRVAAVGYNIVTARGDAKKFEQK